MKSILTISVVVLAAALVVGCAPAEQAPTPDTTEVKAAPQPTAQKGIKDQKNVPEMQGPDKLEVVEVTPEGSEFEPPLKQVQVPVGAWFCDMGTVHYARSEQGDGTCPKCGMKLVHKEAKHTAPAAPATDG